MARLTKDCKRDSFSFVGKKKNLFVLPDGEVWDSETMPIVHIGLDTVRQLYNGLILNDVYERVQAAYDAGFGEGVKVGLFDYVVSSGGRSGYRFILRNENVGLTVMYGSSFCEPCYRGAHLKIQCSPVFLLSRSLADIQADLDSIAEDFIYQEGAAGVAVHIACDFQGWVPPSDLDARLVTKAKRIYKNSGKSSVVYEDSGCSTVYGAGQSFTFGSASSLQFACYNKGKAVKDKGELPLWLPVWSLADRFSEADAVWRIEARFHHSVIEQFARGSGFTCVKLIDLEKHLTGLWRYALQHNRLDCSPTYIDPVWQYLRDDVEFYHAAKLDIDYKRMYQSPLEEGLPSDRSVLICFGQMCTIWRKKKMTVNGAIQSALNSGLWDLIIDVYAKRGMSSDDVMCDIESKMLKKKTVH